jgi:hypothetical protein
LATAKNDSVSDLAVAEPFMGFALEPIAPELEIRLDGIL